jgi:sec-independent protein translocase protein TatC
MAYVDQFKDSASEDKKMSFLEHLEELRVHLFRSAIAITLFAILAFFQKELLFDGILLAPKRLDFVTYRFFCELAAQFSSLKPICFDKVGFVLSNIDMSGQFFQHFTVSFMAGIILAFPYIAWEFWRFIKPALKSKEKKVISGFVFYVSMLFFMGVTFGYFLIAPISIMFLGTYQVSAEVVNYITLDSYLSTLSMITLATGIIFELPVIAYILAKVGLLSADFMVKYRRHAIVVNLFIAAILTPNDLASMQIMSIPLLLLYEISILIIKRIESKENKKPQTT